MEPRHHHAIAHVGTPVEMLGRVVDGALVLLPRADGAVVETLDGADLVYVCAGGTLAAHVGTRLALTASLSGQAILELATLHSVDTEADPRVDRLACRQLRIRSMVCVPLIQSGHAVGVLQVSSSEPAAFDDADVDLLNGLAHFIATVIAAATDLGELSSASTERPGFATQSARFMSGVLRQDKASNLESRARIEQALAGDELTIVCQPVVDLTSGQTVGAEALSRFHVPPQRSPDVWFAEAESVGLGVDLELAALRAALATLPALPPGAFLAINASAATLEDPRLLALVLAAGASRIVLELTEHTRVGDYDALRTALDPVRRAGARLAVDDAGSGFSSLSHILKLAPDIIKIDRSLTAGLDADAVRQAMVAALVTFAERTGAQVVAEGIETAAELATLLGLEIGFGQGYYLARPGPVEDLPGVLAHVASGTA